MCTSEYVVAMFRKRRGAKSVKDAVCKALDSFDYKYEVSEDEPVVYLTATGEDMPIGMVLAADDKHKTLNIYCRLMFQVPPGKMDELTVELNKINNTINNGSFLLDSDEGFISFKVIHSYIDGVPSQDLIKHLIKLSFQTADLHDGELKELIPKGGWEMMYR
jgi:hypothetical protein